MLPNFGGSWGLPGSRPISSIKHRKKPATPRTRVGVQTPRSILICPPGAQDLHEWQRLSIRLFLPGVRTCGASIAIALPQLLPLPWVTAISPQLAVQWLCPWKPPRAWSCLHSQGRQGFWPVHPWAEKGLSRTQAVLHGATASRGLPLTRHTGQCGTQPSWAGSWPRKQGQGKKPVSVHVQFHLKVWVQNPMCSWSK